MVFDKGERTTAVDPRWVTGEISGLEIPADAESLVAGGTGKKLLLTVAYEGPAPHPPAQLFIKFSRNFDQELWDRARFMMISEANFAALSRSSDFPVTVPACLFADVDRQSATGLIITECITYGRNGVEDLYPKCMDYAVPDPVAHYRAILTGLATLSGAHRGGRLSPDFDRIFPYDCEKASAVFAIRTPEEKLEQRANRMFDFIERHPTLFPDNVRAAEFRAQFLRDIPDVVSAEGGPRLNLDEMRLHILLIVAVSGVAYAMGAPIAMERDLENLDAVASYRDDCFREHENARIQLHMMTKMLNVWETRKLGDVVRSL